MVEDETMVYFKHKTCGRIWKFSRNVKDMLYCPPCDSEKDWEEISDAECVTGEQDE